MKLKLSINDQNKRESLITVGLGKHSLTFDLSWNLVWSLGPTCVVGLLGKNNPMEPNTLQVWFEFRVFLLLEVKVLSFPNCLPIAGGGIVGFMPFPRVLALCDIQIALSKI